MGRMGLNLLAEMAKVSKKAREQLFTEIYPLLRHYVWIRLRNQEEREDLLQNICLKIATNITKFSDERGSFTSWMYTIARNALTDQYRLKSKVQEEELAMDVLDETENPMDKLLAEETREELSAVLKHLAPQQKAVIEMKFFFQMKNKEIAEQLQIEERSVSSALSRSLQKLQKILNKGGFDG
jgi:RNA polymerase sigma factor (sigma-70 family)